jgi:hypothetical protein
MVDLLFNFSSIISIILAVVVTAVLILSYNFNSFDKKWKEAEEKFDRIDSALISIISRMENLDKEEKNKNRTMFD